MHTGRHANVRWMKRCGKGMSGKIQPATLEVISHRRQDQPPELELASLVIGVVQDVVIDLNRALCDSLE